jgi:HK97 family phage portal protein
LYGGYTSSTVTPTAALAIADVWAAVRVLADAASSLPLHVYRKTEVGRERVTSGKLVDLLDRPGPATSQADLISSLMAHLAIYGNAYIAKYRQAGEIVQLGLIHPERIRPELEGGRLRFRYSPGAGPEQLLTEADVVHVKGLSIDGLTPACAAAHTLRARPQYGAGVCRCASLCGAGRQYIATTSELEVIGFRFAHAVGSAPTPHEVWD